MFGRREKGEEGKDKKENERKMEIMLFSKKENMMEEKEEWKKNESNTRIKY